MSEPWTPGREKQPPPFAWYVAIRLNTERDFEMNEWHTTGSARLGCPGVPVKEDEQWIEVAMPALPEVPHRAEPSEMGLLAACCIGKVRPGSIVLERDGRLHLINCCAPPEVRLPEPVLPMRFTKEDEKIEYVPPRR